MLLRLAVGADGSELFPTAEEAERAEKERERGARSELERRVQRLTQELDRAKRELNRKR